MEQIAEVPYRADEKETLTALLDMQRAAILAVCEGCSEDNLRKRLVPSMTTILGIVKHLAYVEGWWFHTVFGGEEARHPSTEDDPDADFRIEDHETTEEILALYASQCEKSRAIVAAAALDDVGTDPRPSCSKVVSLRWIIGRMIWETARHTGQADILREQLDGAAGLGHSGAPTID